MQVLAPGGVIIAPGAAEEHSHCSVSAGEKETSVVFRLWKGLVAPYHNSVYRPLLAGSVCKERPSNLRSYTVRILVLGWNHLLRTKISLYSAHFCVFTKS